MGMIYCDKYGFGFDADLHQNEKQQSAAIVSTNFDILDIETNQSFKIDNVIVKLDIDPETTHRSMILEHPSLKFVSKRWCHGYRADLEIHEHINPQMVGYGCDLFVGDMTISAISTPGFVPLKRRTSLVDGNIIESSNDFLA
uniref:GMC_oxred_C domain-containing protein n=1 Tax=Loa loa TaxID=7209 RepID=A0A1I7V8K9_LOALO